MFRSYRIGTLLGFPIEINLSFLLLLGVALVWMGGIAGVLVVLMMFASVLLHELGHAVVARHLKVPIAGIELHFFGGMAKMAGMPRTANDEVAIAAAGPIVSFALGGLGLLAGSVTGLWLFQLAGWINVVIGAFNLVPALPMDGGRILRALLTRKMSFSRATQVALQIARGFAVVLGVYGAVTGHLWYVVMAFFLWSLGGNERAIARQLEPHMAYDRTGYRRRDYAFEPEVMPFTAPEGFGGFHGRGGFGGYGWSSGPSGGDGRDGGDARGRDRGRDPGSPLGWFLGRRR